MAFKPIPIEERRIRIEMRARVCDVIWVLGMADSKSEARRLMKEGGVTQKGVKITDVETRMAWHDEAEIRMAEEPVKGLRMAVQAVSGVSRAGGYLELQNIHKPKEEKDGAKIVIGRS